MYVSVGIININIQIHNMLTSADIDISKLPDLDECFSHHEQLFAGLETKHLQLKYYQSNFNLIVRT